MDQEQRERFVKTLGDLNLRKVAEEHPDCLHPCVWLVKGNDGPLEAGGKPRLPQGRPWPRADGKLLAYLLSIDTSLLPAWSPLPRDAGHLLLFVGHNTCEVVMVAPGTKTVETEPPLEEYLSGEPTAGNVLDSVRFRLEEGLHAGMPATWSPLDGDLSSFDFDLAESLRELNRALEPKDAFGRLFGFHEWWSDADPALITKYSYLDVNGFLYGWYQDLDGSVDELKQLLEKAKSQKSPTADSLPPMSDTVVKACEAWAATVESKIAERSGLKDANVRKTIAAARTAMSKRQKRWQLAKSSDTETANQALRELISQTSQIDREMDHIPNTDDPEMFKAQMSAAAAKETEEKLQWSQRAMANLKEEARIRKENAHDPAALAAAMDVLKQSTKPVKTAYSELIALLTPLQYAVRQPNTDVIRSAWNEFEAKLNQVASELNASQLSTALHWRLECFQNLLGWLRQQYIDPTEIAGKIDAIQWWQANVPTHEAEINHWRPLLVMDSDGGPYFWGDAGWAIILADRRKIAKAELGRLAIAVDVS